MRLSKAAPVIALLTVAIAACGTGGAGSAGAPETLEERASYAIGYMAGENFASQEAPIDVEQLVQGLRDAIGGLDGALTAEERDATMMEFSTMMSAADEARASGEADANKAAGDAYLAENATREGVIVLESGLQYEVITEGTGASPLATDTVTVHYVGTLVDGSGFESSRESGQPATFPLNQVIPGWTEGVQLMKVGGTYKFFIPGELGYGMQVRPGSPFGPMATLIFEVELLAINGQS